MAPQSSDDQKLPRSVLPISLTVFAQMIGEGIAISTVPLHLRALGASPIQVGAATSAFSVAQLICCPLLVTASNTIGRSNILRICLAGASVSQLLITLSSSIYGVIFGRFLGGVFAASVPVAQAGVTDLVPSSQSALALSRVSAASQLGVVVGPAFSACGAALLAYLGLPAHLRVRGVFAASALFALGVLGVLSLAAGAAAGSLPSPPRPAAATATAAPPAPTALAAEPAARSSSRRLSDTLPFSSNATRASERLPLARAVQSGALAQCCRKACCVETLSHAGSFGGNGGGGEDDGGGGVGPVS